MTDGRGPTILFQTEKKTMNFGKGRLVKCMKFTE